MYAATLSVNRPLHHDSLAALLESWHMPASMVKACRKHIGTYGFRTLTDEEIDEIISSCLPEK